MTRQGCEKSARAQVGPKNMTTPTRSLAALLEGKNIPTRRQCEVRGQCKGSRKDQEQAEARWPQERIEKKLGMPYMHSAVAFSSLQDSEQLTWGIVS
eukprot:767126-Hanusia_phi.AAC.3